MVPQPNQYTPKKEDADNYDLTKTAVDYPKINSNNTNQKPTEKKDTNEKVSKKITIIPLSQTREEYEKAKLPFPFIPAEDEREIFERQTKGQWKRKVTKIVLVNTIDDEKFLDWSEEREGKTSMGRKIHLAVDNVSKYIIPVPQEKIEFDADAEENKLVQEDREKETISAYSVPYSKEALNELLEDCKPRQCEYIIVQEGARNYSVSKKELEKYASDFETLYSIKSDPTFKVNLSSGEAKKV